MSATPIPLVMGRFKRLPQRHAEVWQLAIRRFPAWIENPDDPSGPPSRPLGAFWISRRTGLIHPQMAARPDEPVAELALRSFLEFGLKWAKSMEGRPSRVEVTDPALRDALAPQLIELDTVVSVVASMPELDAAFLEMEKGMGRGQRFPGMLEQPGVTPDRVRAFADAAAEFFVAQPWRHLAGEDLIVVEARNAPKGLTHLSVMGQAGQEFGLSFMANRKAFERLIDGRGAMPVEAYGITFGSIDEIPFADGDAWEAHDLPVASPRAYPLFSRMRMGGEMTRPTAAELTFGEALLRALARVTENELDAGRWESRVETFGGAMTLLLSVPFVLEALVGRPRRTAGPGAAFHGAERANAAIARFLESRPDASIDDINEALAKAQKRGTTVDDLGDVLGGSATRTPLDEAQTIAYDAMEAQGRARIALARRALAVSPDCADAWGILGDASPDIEAALAHYERAVEAGRRAIGERFDELRGEFWGHLITRPYMRARLSLGQVLEDLKRPDEARVHYADLLRLNPNDNQGIRYLLLPLLLARGDDEAAGALLEEFASDRRAMWPYAAVLRVWRREGDTAQARATLDHAVAESPYVLDYLLDPESIPEPSGPFVTPGGRDDAASVARSLAPAFLANPGILEWAERRRPKRARRPKKR